MSSLGIIIPKKEKYKTTDLGKKNFLEQVVFILNLQTVHKRLRKFTHKKKT